MVKNVFKVATTVVASTALVLAGLGATGAQAHRAASDSTRVAIAPRVATQMEAAGIRATPIGAAKKFAFKGTVAFRFPVSRIAGHGNRILHTGGIKLSTSRASLPLTKLRVNLRQKTVSAVIGGDARANFFKVKQSSRPALGSVRLVFNKLSAGVLNTTFNVNFFKRGNNFGFAKLPR